MNWETAIFFGDSLTTGARTYLGYPEYCGDFLQQVLDKNWNVINHSENGMKAIDLARSISKDFSNLQSCNSLLSVILIGTNDAKVNTPESDYRIALEQVIVKAKLLTENNNVLLLHIPKLTNGIALPYKSEMNNSIEIYNNTINELATKHNIDSLEIEMKNAMLTDGVHFNKEGTLYFAKKIVENILLKRGM